MLPVQMQNNPSTRVNIQNLRQMPQQLQASQTEEEEGEGGSHRRVHVQKTAENGGAGDRSITYIVIDDDYEKSSEGYAVSIDLFY